MRFIDFSLRVVMLSSMLGMVASAVNEKKNGWPWTEKLHGYHDAEVAKALGAGWFLNVGPTGIRIRIMQDQPKYMTVKYVFKKCPAAGIVRIDDVIVGANGTRFTVPHQFGRGVEGMGWEGPMLSMSKLIEDSQGKDGKLDLIIWPGGVESKEKVVTLQIPVVGRFSPTWPYNCPRSDKLLTDICDFLISEYKRAGKFENGVHTNASCILALMASGNPKYQSLVENLIKDYYPKRYDSTYSEGFPVWGQVHDAIVMGEYYLLKKDKKLLPAMNSLADCLNDCAWPETGGFSHKPFAGIQRRMAEGGKKGYGAMALPGGLGMLGLSLFKEAGLPHADHAYQRIHEAFLSSVAPNGSIDYGFAIWDHVVIELEDPHGNPKPSPRGIGFECLDGMKGIGKYSIVWPTKKDPRYRPTDWLESEKETNIVFTSGKNQRFIIRNMSPKEPTKPYNQNGLSCDHYARSGVGALAHKIGNSGNQSWGYLGDLMATGCAMSGKALLDGHASTHMHVLWGSLGAALASEKEFRDYLDSIKWWMIMAQAHDGGYVVMPGRDYVSTDHVYGTRNFPAACAALILAIKEKRLRITGATGSPDVGGASRPASRELPLRAVRSVSASTMAMMNQSLLVALAELEQKGKLSPVPIPLSKALSKVWFSGFDDQKKLVFRALKGQSKAAFAFDELQANDCAVLACLVAQLKPENREAQVNAGVYLEVAGNTQTADVYFQKAGSDAAEYIKTLFQ